jgi:ATP-binding cassette subfamily B protein
MDIIFREYGAIIRQKWGWFFMVMLGISGGAGLDLLVPLFYKEIANGLSKPFSDGTHAVLLQNLGYIALTYALIWLSWRALELGMIMFQSWGLNKLDKRCFDVLIKQRQHFFENNFAGSLVKQANRFIKAFETIIDWMIFQLYGNLLRIAIAFIIFYQQQPQFALYFLIWVVIFLGWSGGFLVWKLKFDLRVAAMDSKLGGAYADGISNMAVVKSFALEQRERANISHIADESYRKRNRAWLLTFVSFAVQGTLVFGIELLRIIDDLLDHRRVAQWRISDRRIHLIPNRLAHSNQTLVGFRDEFQAFLQRTGGCARNGGCVPANRHRRRRGGASTPHYSRRDSL